MSSISVVIPTFECGLYLETAVASVRLQAATGIEVDEIVIVDDGSSDGTEALIDRLGSDVVYMYQENQGPSAARNRGVETAAGEYLCLLDADDALAPGALAHHRSRLDADPTLMVARSYTQFVRELQISEAGFIKTILDGEPQMTGNVGSCLFRREAFDAVGPFDEDLRNMEDVDWFLRARDLDLRTAIDHRTALYRLRRHGSQSQKPVEELQTPLMQVLRAHAARRQEDDQQ